MSNLIYSIPSGLKPNRKLEKAFMTGKKAFGKELSVEEREAIRQEINFRNREGIYVFSNRREEKRLAPIVLNYV